MNRDAPSSRASAGGGAATTLPPRPTRLPIAPIAAPARRHLPLTPSARPVDLSDRPIYAVWELTLRCDLACRHCGSRAGRARPSELTTDEALDVVAQLAAMGTREVTLIGGEAYLHEGWEKVARALCDAGIEVSVVTGGRGFDAERARIAAGAGVASVGVSLDALETLHDELRGVRGAFATAVAAIGHARAAGLRATANTQITRPALRQIEPLFERIADAGAEAWQVSMTVPMGRAADEPGLILEPYQVLEVMPMLARIAARARARGVHLAPGNDIGYFGPYETVLRPHGPRLACTAGRLTLGIEADGSVKGCPSLPTRDYVGGNVRDDRLVDIWERAPALRINRERTTSDLWGYCADCYYAEPCLGGCSWTAHVLFGKTGNNPFCHHRALELLAEGKRERLVQTAEAEGAPFDYGRFACVIEPWPTEELGRAKRVVASGQGWLEGEDA